jgi:hypothetical protein
MKRTYSGTLSILSRNEIGNLTREIMETIGFTLLPAKAKTFTSADLWNIQRQGKTRTGRRFL